MRTKTVTDKKQSRPPKHSGRVKEEEVDALKDNLRHDRYAISRLPPSKREPELCIMAREVNRTNKHIIMVIEGLYPYSRYFSVTEEQRSAFLKEVMSQEGSRAELMRNIASLGEREREIFIMRNAIELGMGEERHTHKEIADRFDLTPPGVSRAENKILKILMIKSGLVEFRDSRHL